MTDAVASKLRMAVIGCGPIGAMHAEAIASSGGADLVAVCDVDLPRAEALGRRLGASAHRDLRLLLEREKLDAVAVATPDHLHVQPALAAIEARCHVFCEKPLAATVDEARELVGAAAARGVHLAVDYNRRFGFGYRKARELVSAGRIGAIERIHLHVSDRTPPSGGAARMPHGILTTLLTHHIDLARWLAGEIASVGARFGCPTGQGPFRSCILVLETSSGALATISAGYRDGQTRTAERMEIEGSAGSIVVEDVTRAVELRGPEADRVEVLRPSHFSAFHDTIAQHVQAFIAHVASGLEPPVTGLDGLRSLEVAAAAVRSHALGRPVEL
ncbi:MAG: Gfo/Idh/MocA family oxidoreductase [Planctomycetes bacterium]|nr:Gfo/Idh/MocA family oxidoreductase [Planctomycetota bacterium]